MLKVQIISFSYKSGIPKNNEGNGGGFVFDCRALDNPGRKPEYKALTGKDQEVIKYLEKDTRTENFISHIFKIISMSIDNYIERDFTHLSVAFGCTGGQHRSVYCVEKLSSYIKDKYPMVLVDLKHMEL